MKPVCVRLITLSYMVGFENNLAQIIIMSSRYVMNKNHVTRSKVKVRVRTLTLCIGLSETCTCLTHKCVMHSGIYK